MPDDDLDEFRDMIRTRREIERLCLAKAIDRGDANWEAEIVRSYHVMSRTPFPDPTDSRETTANWERCHRQFHYALVAACGSDWLLQFWNTLADQSERYRKLRLFRAGADKTRQLDAQRDHEMIMEAVIGRDVAAATDLMDAHLIKTEKAISKLLKPKREPESERE